MKKNPSKSNSTALHT